MASGIGNLTGLNLHQFEWQGTFVEIDGGSGPVLLNTVDEISYTASQEKRTINGAFAQAISIYRGRYDLNGELVVHQSEYEAMAIGAPNGSRNLLLASDVTIKVTYTPGAQRSSVDTVPMVPSGLTAFQTVTDVLQGVEFSSIPKSIGNNQPYQMIRLPFTFLRLHDGTNT